MGFLLRSPALWHLLILPVRLVIWTGLALALAAVFPAQAVQSAVRRQNRFGRRPVPFLILFIKEGTDRGRFDKRFVLLHPAMSCERFWRIFVQRRPFETTFERVLVCDRDQVAVPYLGHFDQDERIDPHLLDARPVDYVLVPATVARPATGLFGVVITNQGGFGFGIRNGDKLVFRDARVTPPAEADVVLRESSIVERAASGGGGAGCLGVLVGAVGSDGTASPLHFQTGGA